MLVPLRLCPCHRCFPTKRAFDEDEILGELTQPLREAICKHKTASVLSALHILDSADPGLSAAISTSLKDARKQAW